MKNRATTRFLRTAGAHASLSRRGASHRLGDTCTIIEKPKNNLGLSFEITHMCIRYGTKML
jgi:hypothetical protein